MFINKTYLYETASPHSQEGIKALQRVSACVKKIRHIKRKLKDLASPILALKGNTVKTCSLSTATRKSRGELAPTHRPLGWERSWADACSSFSPKQSWRKKKTRSLGDKRFCDCELTLPCVIAGSCQQGHGYRWHCLFPLLFWKHFQVPHGRPITQHYLQPLLMKFAPSPCKSSVVCSTASTGNISVQGFPRYLAHHWSNAYTGISLQGFNVHSNHLLPGALRLG